jgi:hypothetical protein
MPSPWATRLYRETHPQLAVRVSLTNEAGDQRVTVAFGETTDEAIAAAVALAEEQTGDPTWVMNDWSAA